MGARRADVRFKLGLSCVRHEHGLAAGGSGRHMACPYGVGSSSHKGVGGLLRSSNLSGICPWRRGPAAPREGRRGQG
eukprot:CAMPEP_0174922386 /NCGR_PEP_ID=MMETSP1355-20121228/5843_1 /TAXON_ID=464990 /ORGANISM="Hemiselmis tepida, Strain CCMP443" /LENGTH=76 /DNA_ID=CAMNT_0016167971 /DNA_START=442 /DNA_END=669 /DNA_ORIENTATION=-